MVGAPFPLNYLSVTPSIIPLLPLFIVGTDRTLVGEYESASFPIKMNTCPRRYRHGAGCHSKPDDMLNL